MSTFFKTLDLDFIGASPLIRTQQTASVLSKELNIPVKTFEGLKARHYGPWEGKTIDAIRQEHSELFHRLSCCTLDEIFLNAPLKSIESYQTVSDRALNLLNQIEDNVLLITHSGVMSSILLALKFQHPHIPLIEHTGYVKLRREAQQLIIEEVQGLVDSKKLMNKDSAEPIFIF
jgi:broad specificity phosphatase PhoE